jgi:glucoamylase
MNKIDLGKKEEGIAPGWPGIPAQWISSAKSGVGTALNPISQVWFTISHGILTEVYYPGPDQACTRDMGLIVTNGKDFFSEEKWDTEHKIEYLAEGVPAFKLINTCLEGRYRIEKEIITDPSRDCVLQRTKFIPLRGKIKNYNLYVLLAPHIANLGAGNNAWLGEDKGVPMLFAEREGVTLALCCSRSWKNRSVGYVGASDGWQDISRNKHMTWHHQSAKNGNVCLTGEVDMIEGGDEFVIAIGFGKNAYEAGQRARASLVEDFDLAKDRYIYEWQKWHRTLLSLKTTKTRNEPLDLYLISASVLKVHEGKKRPGGLVASLSIPWGFSKGDEDFGGYHLVWPRDMVQTASGLLALKAGDDALKALNYLMITQEADGHWAQNMWMDGTPYWGGIQMDQTGAPILLLDLASREGTIDIQQVHHFWPMVYKAAKFLVCNGPTTHQCRWEENAGYSPYTLAIQIAALLAAADFADLNNEPEVGTYLRETADLWNSNIEKWTYVTDTDLARRVGVEGYYVRISSPNRTEIDPNDNDIIPIINRKPGENYTPVSEMISPDALALVRYGLRAADDPKILNTIKVIDSILKVETPYGPCWYRYNGDGYGEHEDGSPFNGTGRGRPWPLLTGEIGHYEIAAGNFDEAKRMLKAVEAFANEGGMIPEQIWDTDDIPEKELIFGRPTGAAMPLAWAHAEYIKLCRSITGKRVFDMPPQTKFRYVDNKVSSNFGIWRFSHRTNVLPVGKKVLRIEVLASAIIRWSDDNWQTVNDIYTTDTKIGMHIADIPVSHLPIGGEIAFTFYWLESQNWEHKNFQISVGKKKEQLILQN